MTTLEYKGHTIHILPDSDPPHPRKDQNNLAVFAFFHTRYDLGDKPEGLRMEYCNGWTEMEAHIRKTFKPVYLTSVYMYDHSGLALSTEPFSCPWDSGQIGFAYITRESWKARYGTNRITAQHREKFPAHIRGELKDYETYLNNDYVGWRIDEDGDSCWGYSREEDAIADAKGSIDNL